MTPLTRTMLSVLAALMVLLPGTAPAGQEDDPLSTDGFVMRFWGTREGLPSSDTWPILLTRDGYIWIGTGYGVARFDGMRFTAFNTDNTPPIHAHEVKALHEDNRGRLWIGFFNGGVVVRENGAFTTPRSLDTLHYASVTGIFSDSAGSVYLCTSLGVVCVDADTTVFLEGLRENPSFGFTGPDGALYFAGNRITRWTRASGPRDLVPTMPANPITSALFESPGRLLVVHPGLITTIDLDSTLAVVGMQEFPVRGVTTITPDPPRGYFIGTLGYGVASFDGSSVSHPNGLGVVRGAGRQIHALMRDSEGGLWATTSGGLYRFSRSFFTNVGAHAGIANDFTWLVHQQKNGTLWVGLAREGMYRIAEGRVTLLTKKDGMPDDYVTELFEDADGRMWFGGVNGGLVVYDGRTFRPVSNQPAYMGGRVLSMAQDARRRMLIATRRALHIMEDGRITPYRLNSGDLVVSSRFLIPTPEGDLWGASGMTFRVRNGSIRYFHIPGERSQYGTTAILVDSGMVWYGTYGSGLYLIRGDSVMNMRRITRKFGPRIIAIHRDDRGYLWINAERELQRVRRADLLAAIDDTTRTVDVEVFNHLDGLENIEFNSATSHSAQQLPDGRILYASTSGIVVVNPEEASRSTSPPPPIIERIIADEVAYEPHLPIELPPGTRRIDIEFTAIRFQSPGRVRFQYTLDPVDKAPVIQDGLRRRVTYMNPGPGTFTFTVNASVTDGPWHDSPASVTFTVTPWFWERPAVQAGAALLLAGILAGGYWLRVTRFRRRNRQLEEEIQRRVAAETRIRASLDEKTVLLKEIHHRVKNNLQIVSSLISLQLGNSRDPGIQEALQDSQARIRSMALVHEALYRNDNLATIDFRTYLDGLSGQIAHAHRRRNVAVRLEGSPVTLSLDQAIPAGLIMNELLTNAFKHAYPGTAEGTITVTSRTDGNGMVEFVVSDGGPGLPPDFDPARVTSLGYHLITSLVQQLSGTIRFANDHGTTVTVRFPAD